MARGRKKKKDEAAEGTGGAPAQNGIGHNSKAELTPEQRKALTFQHLKSYERLLGLKKAADKALKDGCKLIKAELGADGVSLIKDMIAMRTPEGEADIRAAIERQRRAAEYMGAPLGAQLALFDQEDRTPAVDRARAEGERDGMDGKSLSNPYDASLPQAEAYAEGWHFGQKAIFNIQPLEGASGAEGSHGALTMDAGVTIALDGEPRGKGRPRFTRLGRAYTDAATRRYEAALRAQAVRAMAGRAMLDGPLFASVCARFPIPPSWPKGKRALAGQGKLWPTVTPDADNLLKNLDALNEVVFADDRQIVSAVVRKEYGTPGLTIRIEPWGRQ